MGERKLAPIAERRGLVAAASPGGYAAWMRRLNVGTLCKYLPRNRRRRGAILVAVIVCVAVAGVILVSIGKIAAARHRVMLTESWGVQADWLAESGLERAAWRLAADADYEGETWTLAAEQLTGAHAAAVTIEVEAIGEQPSRRLVRARADYPDHPQRRARRSKQAVVQLLQETGEEP